MRYCALPEGHRRETFTALAALTLDDAGWQACPTDWRAPFLPAATGAWASFPALDDFFVYNGSGVLPGRTWVIAPDKESLERRWEALRQAPMEKKEVLFHPHLRGGEPGDRHVARVFANGLAGYPHRAIAVGADRGPVVPPVRYAFRSFDRQWIIPDYRLINQPNPRLWAAHSGEQVYLTALERTSPSAGPGLTISGHVPDLDHYNGRGGRTYTLWSDASGTAANVPSHLMELFDTRLGTSVDDPAVLAYVAAIAASPAYTARCATDLVRPGLRIPLTGDATLFARAVALGRHIIWLHTFGERFTDSSAGRHASAPRMTGATAPNYPSAGAIPSTPDAKQDTIGYDVAGRRLQIGTGFIDNVDPAVWAYEVSGKQVLKQWFSYRKRDRERPLIGDRRPPSPLGDIQPDHWLAEYTSDLIDLLHVLTGLVALEPEQAQLLDDICAGPLVSASEVEAVAAAAKAAAPLPAPVKERRARGAASAGKPRRKKHDPKQGDLL